MKKMALLADDPTISFVLYSNLGCLFLTAVSPLSFVNFVKWTPQSVMSYLGTRLVSFSSILKRKNTATALRIVRLFARWTRKPCARIIRLCYVPRKRIYKCINRLSYDSWSTDLRFLQLSPSNSSAHMH